jgi:hypothetical protein
MEGIHCCEAMENTDLAAQMTKLRSYDRAEKWRDKQTKNGFPGSPADVCAYDTDVATLLRRYAHCHNVFSHSFVFKDMKPVDVVDWAAMCEFLS